jgi:hypothetical protein
MKKAIVKLVLGNFQVVGSPGDIVKVWGYEFIVNQAGDCISEMPIETAENEASAKRVEIMLVNDDEPEPAQEQEEDVEIPFTKEIETWFGCGTAEDFKKMISKLPKWKLIDFANENLRMSLAPINSKTKMIADICNAVGNLIGGEK